MNLLFDYQNKFIESLKILRRKKLIDFPDNLKGIIVELPPKKNKAHISFNAAMILSKFNNKSPIDVANILKKNFIENFKEFQKIDVAEPGFININFKIEFWENYLLKILKLNEKFGSFTGSKNKYNIEFVSANPTGPLHVGHCRGAILGDTLSNLLKFNGNVVTKEYYVNDYGGQVKNFVNSVYHRILELTEKKKFPTDKDLYPGDYIVDIAKKILKDKKINDFKSLDKIFKKLSNEALNISIEIIKSNLKELGVKHDNFVYESELVKNEIVSKTIQKLQKDNYVYKGKLKPPKGDIPQSWVSRDQLLFSSTKFGDDVDRALQKNDMSWTYFANDIAYHNYKIDRNFDKLINILGSDHTGYTNRISAAVKALSKDKINLVCKVSQLVKLFKEGKPFKMSKRKGDYITVEDLVNEVGKDCVRFIMLNRSSDVELDFDFKKVTEKTKDNPIFYVQYAYARINSIFRTLRIDIEKDIKLNKENFNLNNYEIEILKKIAEWPRCIEISSLKLEPHRIPFYLYDLVTLFHSYWNLGNENKEFRFVIEGKSLNNSRLLLLKALSIVIRNGMSILGVSTPKAM